MSNKPADVSVSPYLSFRQAVRPAIFANSLLLREKERAGELADVANQILTLTRDLMRTAGLGYIATPEPGASVGEGNGIGRLDSLLDAFADAAMTWAQIVGGCLALADGLLEQGRFDEVRSLAAVLDDSGESGTAHQLLQRLAPTIHRYQKSLGPIHTHMKLAEIEHAIDVLTEALTELPQSTQRNNWVNSYLPTLATSVLAHVNTQQFADAKRVASGYYMAYPANVENALLYIAIAFRATAIREQ